MSQFDLINTPDRDHGLSGTNLERAHRYNQRIVLETVRLHGPLSRADISRLTALTGQTVGNIVDKLIERRVLESRGRRMGRRGQPATEIGLNADGGFSVGLHLDRDHLDGVLVDLSGTVRQSVHVEWHYPSPQHTMPYLIDAVRKLSRDEGLRIADLWGLGVALPGPLERRTGRLVAPPNFEGWEGFPLQEILSNVLGLPVYLETDATAAAAGERWVGVGRSFDHFFFVYFGVGLGGGIVINGEPYRGSTDCAAMFGHLPVDPDGERCACGGRGCLELYASLGSLYRTLKEAGIEAGNTEEIAAQFERGEPRLLRWLEHAADRMAPALVTIENLLDPQAIVFGGRLPSPILTRLLSLLEERLPSLAYRGISRRIAMLPAELAEFDAALGAATLPLFDFFTPDRDVIGKRSSRVRRP